MRIKITISLLFSRTPHYSFEACEECITTWPWRSSAMTSYSRVLHRAAFLGASTTWLYGVVHHLEFLGSFTVDLFSSASSLSFY